MMTADLTNLVSPNQVGRFNDLYTAIYAMLDDAKAQRRLTKLYKGSHLARDPHDSVLAFAEHFARRRRGLVSYACARVNPTGPPRLEDLDTFDQVYQPRLSIRAVFADLVAMLRKPGESESGVLAYLTGRTHPLGAYRGGSSGFDEESRVVASAHFRQLGIPCRPEQVIVSCGGAKGIFLAFCAALMCRRQFDKLHHLGGVLLAPGGYYQSLRLIPAVFGGDIHVVSALTGASVATWLARTADHPGRAIYVPLVNNATGEVLDSSRARAIGREILSHNALNRGNPAYVIGDDVYAGSYLDPHVAPMPIGAVPGLSEWTVSVVSPSKTFSLPTSRVAFATTTNQQMSAALAHYRTVFAHGRVPQTTELAAAAALAFTPSEWITSWNQRYRDRLATVAQGLHQLNTALGFEAVRLRPPQGGWYMPLAIARAAFPIPISSSIDAFAVLLHYGGDQVDSGLGLLPGELFGHRVQPGDAEVTLRATVAVSDDQLGELLTRLCDALCVLGGPDGVDVAERALQRVRQVADIDQILVHTHY